MYLWHRFSDFFKCLNKGEDRYQRLSFKKFRHEYSMGFSLFCNSNSFVDRPALLILWKTKVLTELNEDWQKEMVRSLSLEKFWMLWNQSHLYNRRAASHRPAVSTLLISSPFLKRVACLKHQHLTSFLRRKQQLPPHWPLVSQESRLLWDRRI